MHASKKHRANFRKFFFDLSSLIHKVLIFSVILNSVVIGASGFNANASESTTSVNPSVNTVGAEKDYILEATADESNKKTKAEIYDATLSRHRQYGLLTAPLVGLQIGLGVGLLRNERDPPDQSLRALHTINSLILIGLAFSQYFDGRTLAGEKHLKVPHAHWAYGYLGLIALSGVLGIVQGHFLDRSSRTYDVMASVHTGIAVSSGVLVTMTLFHAPL